MQMDRSETLQAPGGAVLDDDALVNVLSELEGLGDGLVSAGQAAPAAPSGPTRARILIADDSSFIRYGLRKLLSESGFHVLEADGGTKAIQLYKDERPDAVLLDITMPDLDGLSALREIRRLDPRARVAMVTGMGQQSIVLQAIQAGASDFVVKPFEAGRVLAAIQKLVAS
jgi:two-component system, chemotaxis family, chemotaxis protein CheY